MEATKSQNFVMTTDPGLKVLGFATELDSAIKRLEEKYGVEMRKNKFTVKSGDGKFHLTLRKFETSAYSILEIEPKVEENIIREVIPHKQAM